MDPNLKNKVLEDITEAQNILIAVSPNLGFDGLAAGLGLYLSLAKLGKKAQIAAKDPSVGDAQRLYGVDKVGKKGSTKTPVIVVEDAVDTVERVSYSLEGTRLKIVVHPLPGSKPITEEQVSLEYTSSPADLVFAIGFNSSQELREKVTREQQIDSEATIINVSNKEVSQKFAQVDFVSPVSSGVSEVTAKMAQELSLPVDEDIAFNFYSGIQDSTNNFSPNLASPLTFDAASWLIKFGAGKASLAQTAAKPQIPERQIRTEQRQQHQIPQQPRLQPDPRFQRPPQFPRPQNTMQYPTTGSNKSIEEVEGEPQGSRDPNEWLKPPKIYRGSKSFGENKE
ncbi:MAG: hypothetical protein NUV69_02890 [Candidatus Curtissbacteria bacterium]|nr:hypothetical protein [Candidatus Curtissbacteria bacterium]